MKNTVCLVMIAVLLLTGCAQNTEIREQRLVLSVTADSESNMDLKPEDPWGNYDANLSYNGVADVSIRLDHRDYPLAEAISSGLITVEEIIAYAQIDARNGICKLIAHSENGLTTSIYRYHGLCDIRVRNDLYETPDGQQHLIKDLSIFNWCGTDGVGSVYTCDDGSLLDLEDWGLSFHVTDVTSDSIQFTVSQSGGQHFGTLETNSYSFYNLDIDVPVISSFDNIYTHKIGDTPITISNNTSTEIIIDWSDFFENLPSGNYLINLDIADVYDPEAVHPLARNYHDIQCYNIEFTVP